MNQKNIGEINLNAADRLKEFLSRVDIYISCENLSPTKFNPEFAIAETFSLEQISKLTRDECFDYAYMLYQYTDHVASERSKCETALRWCENNLNSIIAHEIKDMSGEYLKYDIKVANILKTNDLASKINDWKLSAQSRLEPLKSREYNIRRKADILIEKGKRK